MGVILLHRFGVGCGGVFISILGIIMFFGMNTRPLLPWVLMILPSLHLSFLDFDKSASLRI
jgi:hypothetical protein